MIRTTHQIYSGDQIKKNATGGHVARTADSTGGYRVSVGTPEGKRPLGIPRRRWKENIKMYLYEVGWGGKDRTGLA